MSDPEPAGTPRSPVRITRFREVSSTQDIASAALADGDRPPFAVLAGQQSAGRGRLGRRFVSPEGGALALTVAHRTALPPARRTWFPLAAGVATLSALRTVLGDRLHTEIGLKWPNDIHTADGRKLGGILVEGRGADAVLIGIGLNLAGPIHEADGREVPGAAWLRGPGGIAPLGADGASREDGDSPTSLDTLRETIAATLATALLAELTALESSLGDAQVAGTRQRYTMSCLTVGQLVRIHPLGGSGGAEQVSGPIGIAQDIDVHGRLVLRDDRGQEVAVDVGDVRHLRPGRLSGVDEGTAAHRGEQEEHTT